MERENSYLFTEEEKKKQASVKMELEICELYCRAIKKLLGETGCENQIKNIRRFLQIFSLKTNSQRVEHLSLKKIVPKGQLRELKQTLYYRILYIYWNSTCFSSAVAHHFRNFLSKRSCVFKELLAKRSIRMCSLSGGCLPDVIAMVKVLEFSVNDKEYLDIHVSVIDIDERWKNTCITILQMLDHFRNATWKIDFIQADLTKPFNDSVQKMIKNADFVSMVMFLSEVKNVKKQQKIIPRVQKLMQPGSILFFQDYSRDATAFGNDSDEITKCSSLYISGYDVHTLDEAVLEKVFRFYYDKFHLSQFCTNIRVLTRVWQRCSNSNSLNETYLKFMEAKLAEIEKNLTKSEARLQRVKEQILWLEKSKRESVKHWEIFFNYEKKKGWWNMKQIRKIVRPDTNGIEAKLKIKMNLLASITEDKLFEQQELKKIQSFLSTKEKDSTVASTEAKTEGKEEKKRKKYVKKFMKDLMKNYKENYKSGSHFMVPEKLFAQRGI